MKSSRMSGGIAGVVLLTIALTGQAADPKETPKAAMPSKLWDAPPPPAGFPKFKVQEIATDFKIGYAVHICDVNGDSKPDIVVVDQARVVWYENPTWKMRTILTGKTKPDNVCICSVKHEGKICFVLGAGWKPFDTKNPGTLQWLQRGKTLDEEWELFPMPCEEPTVHRVQAVTDNTWGTESTTIWLAPLMGRDATKEGKWMDGKPVRILQYPVPKDPTKLDSWKPVVINEELHVVHNFFVEGRAGCVGGPYYCFASYEGVSQWTSRPDNLLKMKRINEGNQLTPLGNRGASEIDVVPYNICTIEPWHGHQVAYYRKFQHTEVHDKNWRRLVIDDHLRWGHAVKWFDAQNFDFDAPPMMVAGVRDNPDPKQGDTFTEKRGVRLYRNTDGKGEKWDRYLLEDGGVAVEDLQVADLDGDGKPEIIAVGRATGNCRIYWNKGK